MARAAQEYLAAVAPLNAARDSFVAALANPGPCTCPAGEVNIKPALAQIPGIENRLKAFKLVLLHIEAELPPLGRDLKAVIADADQEYSDLSYCLLTDSAGDARGLANAVLRFAEDHQGTRPDFARVRGDLQLPPPPTGGGATTLTRMTRSAG